MVRCHGITNLQAVTTNKIFHDDGSNDSENDDDDDEGGKTRIMTVVMDQR